MRIITFLFLFLLSLQMHGQSLDSIRKIFKQNFDPVKYKLNDSLKKVENVFDHKRDSVRNSPDQRIDTHQSIKSLNEMQKAKEEAIKNADIIPEESKPKPPPAKCDCLTETVFDRVAQLFKINDADFYVAPFPIINNLRSFPENQKITDAEGAQGTILEIKLAQRFQVLRIYPKKDFFRLTRSNINFDFLYRVVKHPEKNDDDSPGLPLNTKLGFTLFEHAFFPSRTNRHFFANNSFSTDNLSVKLFSKDNLRIFVPRLDVMHYSNGQRNPSTIYPVGSPPRNIYENGNFSTNYFLGKLDYIETNKYNQVIDFSVGYQYDLALGNLLSFDDNQKERYGTHRLLGGITFKSKLRKNAFTPTGAGSFFNRLQEGMGVFDMTYRLNVEQIIHGVSMLNSTRTNITFQTLLTPSFSPDFALMFQAYYGRDYLNIRYDLPIRSYMVALTYNINRYQPPRASVYAKSLMP